MTKENEQNDEEKENLENLEKLEDFQTNVSEIEKELEDLKASIAFADDLIFLKEQANDLREKCVNLQDEIVDFLETSNNFEDFKKEYEVICDRISVVLDDLKDFKDDLFDGGIPINADLIVSATKENLEKLQPCQSLAEFKKCLCDAVCDFAKSRSRNTNKTYNYRQMGLFNTIFCLHEIYENLVYEINDYKFLADENKYDPKEYSFLAKKYTYFWINYEEYDEDDGYRSIDDLVYKNECTHDEKEEYLKQLIRSRNCIVNNSFFRKKGFFENILDICKIKNSIETFTNVFFKEDIEYAKNTIAFFKSKINDSDLKILHEKLDDDVFALKKRVFSLLKLQIQSLLEYPSDLTAISGDDDNCEFANGYFLADLEELFIYSKIYRLLYIKDFATLKDLMIDLLSEIRFAPLELENSDYKDYYFPQHHTPTHIEY